MWIVGFHNTQMGPCVIHTSSLPNAALSHDSQVCQELNLPFPHFFFEKKLALKLLSIYGFGGNISIAKYLKFRNLHIL